MKIGAISDIHDHTTNLEKAIEVLNKEKVNLVFFCGDLTSISTLNYFQKLSVPLKAVFGNMDGNRLSILKEIRNNKLNIQYPANQESVWKLELDNKKVAIFHGKPKEITDDLVNSNFYDLVFTGHTHNSHLKQVGKTLWVNPGCICGWTGLDRRPTKPSLAIVDLKTKKARIVDI